MRLSEEKLRLYLITDRHYLSGDQTLLSQVESALKGGVTMVRFREKDRSLKNLEQEAKAIQALCKQYDVPFIVDDDIALAVQLGADGVHLGQDDMSPKHARLTLGPDKIIGSSVHDEQQAFLATSAGANYLDCGCLYSSISAVNDKIISIGQLAGVVRSANVPVIANGGINRTNLIALHGTGIAGISVARGILDRDDIESEARYLREEVEKIVG